MTVSAFFGIVLGIFKFWDETVWLIKTLQKTPQERHADLLVKMKKEADEFEATGRPTWG